jgi:hypothetical protein
VPTRDEILAAADPVEVISMLFEEVQHRITAVGVDALTATEMTVFSMWDLISEVENGGFTQYFFNSSGDRAREARAALHAIGASETAAIFDGAVARLGAGVLSPDRDVRCEHLRELDESDWLACEPDDDAFCRQPEPLWKLLADYCRAHADELHVRE